MTASWNSTPPEERYDHIGRTLIPNTETVNQVSEALQVSYDSWGTRAEGQVSSIVGHTRFGKSSSVRLFMHKFAKARGGEFIEVHTKHRERKSVAGMDYVVCHDGRQAIKPVIRIAVSASHTYKGLLNDILFYLTGQDKFGRAGHSKLISLMATQIQEQQVRLIVFDEAHRISREGAKEVNILAGDVFSTLAKISKVELMLVGREELDNLYSGNEELDEMREMDFRVSAMAFPTGVDSAFCKFLSSFEKALPFDRKCDISSLEVAQDIHTYTDGSPGAVALMLQLATKYAILNKVDKLDGPVIGLALEWGKGLKGKRNPFLVRGSENS